MPSPLRAMKRKRLGGGNLGTEYILLGVLSQECGAVQIIERLGIDVRALRRELAAQIDAEAHSAEPIPSRLGDDALRILELAMKEAGAGRERYIGTEHLLMAILRGDDSRAATLLKAHAIGIDAVRTAVADLVGPDGGLARSK
jgi:ATP-dependent Clp protease ATP-binding subunit ClpC